MPIGGSLLVGRDEDSSSDAVTFSPGAAGSFSSVNHSSYHHYPTARDYDPASLTFLMMSTAVTWLMLPGVGFFYSGMARSKSALSLMMLCLWSCAVVSIQWYIVGFTLCLSDTGGKLIGNLDHLLMREIGDRPSFTHDQIPLLLVSVWYCLFAAITPTVFLGAVAERARFLPTIFFIFLWTTLVFDFLTYWTWNKNGWSFQLGALDFGGGTPVHISSGASALAFAAMVGRREDSSEKPPQNMSNVYLGTCFIWCGWLVANAGSGLVPHIRAVTVFCTTNLAASMGGITWSTVDYIRHGRKWSAIGFCSGAIAGLVCITPASGYVTPSSSIFFGFAGGLCCNFAMSAKQIFRVDDSFDVFACHGIGGILGNILTGVFAQRQVAAVDGQRIKGGWLDGHWEQVGYQAVDSVAGFVWAFLVTICLLFFIDKFPGLHLRAPPEDQEVGLDKVELGVGIYEHLEELRDDMGQERIGNGCIVGGGRTSAMRVLNTASVIPRRDSTPQIVKNGTNNNIMAISTINGNMTNANGQYRILRTSNGMNGNNANGFIILDSDTEIDGIMGKEELTRVETTEHI